jgi:type I restriction enzyme R subunit
MMQLEKKLVEDWIIEELKKRGWNYIQFKDLKILDSNNPLLTQDLKRKILEINKDIELIEDDLNEVINELSQAPTDQNGHKKILRYLKYGVPIKTQKQKIIKYIQLFDYKNLDNNDFVITNQFKFSGKENIRLDILLIVNGIPLVNIECKNPYTDKVNYLDAYKQIKRYEKIAPELYKYIQIGIGFAEVVKYFPIVPWLEDVKQEIWRWEGYKDEEAIFETLKPETLLDVIRNFIFIREFRGEITKVVARYMQYRAANKIYQRVINNLEGKTHKNKGLIWHWQGSGKTLTMIFTAHKLYFEPTKPQTLGKPTIFFIVDRRDLEKQFNEELSSLDLNFSFERIENINALKEIFSYDDYRGKRGVFLTLIHKFNLDQEFLLSELEENGKIKERKDIICFLDEVHRNQYGKLALKMKSALQSAFFFGFTGTPISYADKDTYKQFGYISDEDKELYLDKYFIDEAEKDGFIVPIIYELRKEKIKLKDEDIEWYLDQVDLEDISDEFELTKIKYEVSKRLNEIRLFLENPNEISEIVKDLAEHFKENFAGKFKGLIVTGSRKACIKYKEFLDNYLPSEYTEVVMTFNQNDEKEIQEYKNQLIQRFKINDTTEIISQIIEKFRKDEYPRLLIVTDMLITGFDEPKLGVLYLHKLLKNHRLLQTIARVNRPYFEKVAGLIVDYIGIFKFIEKAFKFYLEKDEKAINIKEKIRNRIEVFEEFLRRLEEVKSIFDGLVGYFTKDTLEKALELILKREEIENKFIVIYKELRKWYEILVSDERMIKYLTDYKWLTALYERYKKIKLKTYDEEKIEKLFNKTIKIIHELIEVEKIIPKIKPTVIDLNYIRYLINSDLTEKEKTIATLYALKHICVINSKNPIYKSIAKRVKELIQRWQNDEIDYNNLGIEVNNILDEIEKKENEKKQTKLNNIEFGIKVILESFIKIPTQELQNISKEIYKNIEPLIFTGWNKNPAISREISLKIREYLSKIKSKYNLNYEKFKDLHKEIFEFVHTQEI